MAPLVLSYIKVDNVFLYIRSPLVAGITPYVKKLDSGGYLWG